MRSSAIVACSCVCACALLAACEEKKSASAAAPALAESATAAAPPAPTTAPTTTPPSASGAGAAANTAPDAVAAQHVLVAYKGAQGAPKTVTRSKAEAKKVAEDVAARAKSGEDFTSLVATYSDDAGTKERQGSLGKVTREKLVKPFADAAFALPVGGTSGAVETPFGYHVIKRNQ